MRAGVVSDSIKVRTRLRGRGGPRRTFPNAPKQPHRALFPPQPEVKHVVDVTPREEVQSPPEAVALVERPPEALAPGLGRRVRVRACYDGELRVGLSREWRFTACWLRMRSVHEKEEKMTLRARERETHPRVGERGNLARPHVDVDHSRRDDKSQDALSRIRRS